jgi:uncharacterized membrane protein
MATKHKLQVAPIAKWLRKHFLAGLLVIVPVAAAILIIKWLFGYIDDLIGPADQLIFGREVPGFGLAIVIVVIFIIGIISANVLGKRLITYGESLLKMIPIAREIYGTSKQVMESLMMTQTGGFKEVALVEFPRAGMTTIGFVTNRLTSSSGEKLVTLYIPTTPNPTSGFLQILPEDQVTHSDMSVEEAVKMVISGGMVSPEELEIKVTGKADSMDKSRDQG